MSINSSISATLVNNDVQRLKADSIGLFSVLFMTIATAAPITAMLGNVPIAVGSGNGQFAPAGFMVATIILSLFAIGYAEMAKHITATGAFYSFISHGLGRVVGLGSGLTVTLTYIVFEAALIGIFSFFCQDLISSVFHIKVSWIVFALIMLIANGLLSYFDINLAAKVLGLFLILEILMLLAMAVAIFVHGGSPTGYHLETINPLNAFTPAAGIATANASLGLFFAFWSWVGFESTAMYGEESRNPKKIIPLATMIAVIGIGLFYVFISWMAIIGTGIEQSIHLAQDPATAAEIFYTPTRQYYGEWAVTLFKTLVITGSFACGLAFHNCAARYLYALGRENLLPQLGSTLGATHSQHGSPHIASNIQAVIATVIVLLFYLFGKDPYADLYTLLAILGTMGIMIVQALCAFAIVGYFYFNSENKSKAHWFKTGIAPFFGGIGMLYVVYLLWVNMAFAAGAAVNSLLYKFIPYIVLVTFFAGISLGLYFKYRDPSRYQVIGRITLDDK